MIKKTAIVMAGGYGAKLWPRSNEKTPKQFIHLTGEGTMLQNTINRLLPIFDNDDIFIVTTSEWSELVFQQVPAVPKANVLIEPFGKNTAPCIALAKTTIESKYDADTIVFAFPSDHHISNVREFHLSLDIASKVALYKKGIVTIGVQPSRPETAYGYVQVSSEESNLGELYQKGVRQTTAFAEKPDVATAKRFIDSGDFLWNSGIFVFRLDTLNFAYEKYLPEQFKLFNMLAKHIGKDFYEGVVEDIYRQIQSESIDYAIMEKADNVYVVQSTFAWSDVGNWDEQYRLSMKDARNNVIEGEVVAIDVSNCIISTHERMIGIVGVEDLVVIEQGDKILICKRSKSEHVSEIVDYLKRKQINRFL